MNSGGIVVASLVGSVSVGLVAGAMGFCLGTSTRQTPPPIEVPAPPIDPPVITPEPQPARGDQSRFVDVDLASAREIASDTTRTLSVKIEHPAVGGAVYRDAEGAVPVGLVLTEGDAVRWKPRTRQEHIYTVSATYPTGRTSADVKPLDIRSLDQASWAILALNYPEAIRLVQHFNAGDMVEVRYVGEKGYPAFLWVTAASIRDAEAPRPAKVRPIPRSKFGAARG